MITAYETKTKCICPSQLVNEFMECMAKVSPSLIANTLLAYLCADCHNSVVASNVCLTESVMNTRNGLHFAHKTQILIKTIRALLHCRDVHCLKLTVMSMTGVVHQSSVAKPGGNEGATEPFTGGRRRLR